MGQTSLPIVLKKKWAMTEYLKNSDIALEQRLKNLVNEKKTKALLLHGQNRVQTWH